jgi:hypothetical protein
VTKSGVAVGAGVAEGSIIPAVFSPVPDSGVEVGGSGVNVLVALGEIVGTGALVGSVVLQADKTVVSNTTAATINLSR